MALALAVCLITLDLRNITWSVPQPAALKDFGSFAASGRPAAEGQNPYGPYPLVFHTFGHAAPNLTPPVSVAIFHLFSGIDPASAFRAWYLICLGLYLLLSAALLLALAWWAWRCRPPRLCVSGLALVAVLLASPITWVGYMLVGEGGACLAGAETRPIAARSVS